MMKKCIFVLIYILLISSVGCWDRKDIETRGFVLGIAIDDYPPIPTGGATTQNESKPEEEKKFELMQTHVGRPTYAMTVQIPIIKKATFRSSSFEGTGTGGPATHEITQVGNSFFSMTREISSRLELTPYYEHLQALVVSEDVARKGLHEVLDFFIRDHEMRRRTRIFVSKGEAKKVLDVVPRIEDYSAILLAKLPLNSTVNSRLIQQTDLGLAIENIHKRNDFILPYVEATKDEIKSLGAAICKDGKMVGWISPIEVEYIKHIRGLYEGGVLNIKDPYHEKAIVTLEIASSKRKITPICEGDKPKFKIDLRIRGSISEYANLKYHDLLDENELTVLEDAFASKLKEECQTVINSIQERYGADVFHFNTILKTRKPDYWEQINKQWHDIFPTVEVDVSAQVKIAHVGNIR